MDKFKLISAGLFILILVSISCVQAAQAPTQLVLDYSNSQITGMHPGGVGVAVIVIKNNGGYEAKEVTAWIPDTGSIKGGSSWNLGTISPGQSVTLMTTLRVSDDAYIGIHTLTLYLDYKLYWTDDKNRLNSKNEKTNWAIPIDVISLPNIQIDAEKIEFYKDTPSDLVLNIKTQDSVKDLSATLASDCVTVLNSSKKYIGDLGSNKEFKLNYDIVPTSSGAKNSTGACSVEVSLNFIDNSGVIKTEKMDIGLIIQEPDVDFKILDVSYVQTSPGEKIKLSVNLKNIGGADAEDTTVSVSLSDPFVPVDTTEVYFEDVKSGQEISADFNVAVAWDAEIKAYSIPLAIKYNVGGKTYTAEKNIGVDVSGKIVLEVISVEQSGSSLKVEIANIGTRSAEGVKATLVAGSAAQVMASGSGESTRTQRPSGGTGFIPGVGRIPATGGGSASQAGDGQQAAGDADMAQMQQRFANRSNSNQSEPQYFIDYKSDIKPSKQTTFTFDAMISGSATMILEYTGLNNERVTQTERLTVGSSSRSSAFSMGSGTSRNNAQGTSITTYLIYGVIIFLVVFIIYRKYRGESIIPGFISKKFRKNENKK